MSALPGSVPLRFARDVHHSLSRQQREIPCEYLYDEVGSALFEAITCMPEYGVTRAEQRILDRHAGCLAELAGAVPLVVELGSGTGRKTRRVLEPLAARGPVQYCPVDISAAALRLCHLDLGELVSVIPLAGTYLEGLRAALAYRRGTDPVLLLFLGGTIGNFDPGGAVEFLARVRALLAPGDHLLMGADLVKPAAVLIPAYDDAAGITAAFNRNLLARINRDLGGDFAPREFAHEARWDGRHRRIEMHLRAVRRQEVRVPGAGLHFVIERGETIRTEYSYRFEIPGLTRMGSRAGFTAAAEWVDEEWPFALVLWRV